MEVNKFKDWMNACQINKKVQSDHISRLKRIERVLKNDMDDEYELDTLENLLFVFSYLGRNDFMMNIDDNPFPIGKYSMNTYKYSINTYKKYKSNQNN